MSLLAKPKISSVGWGMVLICQGYWFNPLYRPFTQELDTGIFVGAFQLRIFCNFLVIILMNQITSQILTLCRSNITISKLVWVIGIEQLGQKKLIRFILDTHSKVYSVIINLWFQENNWSLQFHCAAPVLGLDDLTILFFPLNIFILVTNIYCFATLLQLTWQKICATTTYICKKVHSKQMKMLGNAAMRKSF